MTNKPTPTYAEIRGLAATGNGVYQDDETAIWEITDPSLMKLVHAALEKWGQPAQAAEPVAYLTRNAEGDPAMLFFDKDEASTYCEDGVDPAPLFTAPQPVARKPLTCEWAHNEDYGFWDTECGQSWRFDDGGPKENHMNFCHCCGKPLRIEGGQHGTDT